MAPPSSTTWRAVPARPGQRRSQRRARRSRAATASSFCQSGYLAQALKRKRAIATSRRPSPRCTKIGPDVARPAAVGGHAEELDARRRRRPTREHGRAALRRSLRRCTTIRTRSIRRRSLRDDLGVDPGDRARTCPASRAALCGQAIQVASWGSHSAGMRRAGGARGRRQSEEPSRSRSAVGVDAAVAQEGPVAPHLLHARRVAPRRPGSPPCRVEASAITTPNGSATNDAPQNSSPGCRRLGPLVARRG